MARRSSCRGFGDTIDGRWTQDRRRRAGIGRQRERAAWRVGRTHFADLIALIDARYDSHVLA